MVCVAVRMLVPLQISISVCLGLAFAGTIFYQSEWWQQSRVSSFPLSSSQTFLKDCTWCELRFNWFIFPDLQTALLSGQTAFTLNITSFGDERLREPARAGRGSGRCICISRTENRSESSVLTFQILTWQGRKNHNLKSSASVATWSGTCLVKSLFIAVLNK